MAGRLGLDWGVAETRSGGVLIGCPAAVGVMGSLCAAVQSVFDALAVAVGGFSLSAWALVHGWAGSGGSYPVAVHGDWLVVAETGRAGSFGELRQVLRAGGS